MNKDIYSGICGGLLSTIICNPLDVIRTHKQLNKKYTLSFKFLYRGLNLSILTIPPFWGIYFPIYNKLKQNNIGILSGYLACNISSTILCPLFFIRQKYQINTQFNILYFYKQFGIKPFYNVLIPTYLLNMSFIFQMPIYEYLKKKINNNNTFNIILITTISKTIATIITYPLDTIRTIKRDNNQLKLINIIKQLNNNKIKYYSGIFYYLSRGIPTHIITFCTYEYLNK